MAMPMQYRNTDVRVFPHTPSEKNKQKTQYNQQEEYQQAEEGSSSTTTMQKLPNTDRYARQNMAIERLKAEFYDAFGREMPRAIAQQVLKDIRSGTPAAYYSYAIEQTIYAPRPSWRYTMAIVARLQRTMACVDDMDFRG